MFWICISENDDFLLEVKISSVSLIHILNNLLMTSKITSEFLTIMGVLQCVFTYVPVFITTIYWFTNSVFSPLSFAKILYQSFTYITIAYILINTLPIQYYMDNIQIQYCVSISYSLSFISINPSYLFGVNTRWYHPLLLKSIVLFLFYIFGGGAEG